MTQTAAPAPDRTRTVPPPQTATPSPKQRRRPAMMGLGIAMVLIFALLGFFLATRGTAPKTVLVTTENISGGQPLTETQVTTTQISGGEHAKTISKESLNSVEGNIAVGDIPAGTILSPDMLAVKTTPDSGQTIVGARVRPGQLPAGGVRAGDAVTVIIAAPQQGDGGSTDEAKPNSQTPTGKAWSAEVVTTGQPGDDGATTVDLVLSTAAAREVGVANGTGRLTLLLNSTTSSSW